MFKFRVIAAAAAVLVGAATLAVSTGAASADSTYFGFRVGGYGGGPAVGFGYRGGPVPPYDAYRPYRPAYGDGWGPVYRERSATYCADVWRTRRIHDQWGRVVKVVKVRDRDCRPGWR